MIKVILSKKELGRLQDFFVRIYPKNNQFVLLDFTTNGKKLNVEYHVGNRRKLERMLRVGCDG